MKTPMLCAVCNSHELIPFARKAEWSFLKCANCAFVFLDPMPSQTTLNTLYADDRGITRTHYPKAGSRYSRALRRALRLLPYLYRKRALDLGCGGGFMTNAMRLCGAHASGLDVNAEAIAYARRRFAHCTFHCASFDDFTIGEPYDFIYSSEMIEHLGDLGSYQRLLRSLSRLGTYVYLTTPDLGSRNVPANFTQWDVCTPPHHVQFFNEDNLRRWMRQAGFEQCRRLFDRKAGLKVIFRRVG